jgi:hypothetical protein
MLSNEKFALKCRAYYDSIGLVVDDKNGEFAHCPLPERYGNEGLYLLHDDHQHQGLLQSRDIGECCVWIGDARNWLETCESFPDNYFDLWDIYEECVSWLSKKSNAKVHAKKDEKGRSVEAVRAAESTNRKKNEEGKSVNAVKGAQAVNKQVWESRIDGYRGSPGSVALHNKRKGWDPSARTRVS